jgi:hypothetical protein
MINKSRRIGWKFHYPIGPLLLMTCLLCAVCAGQNSENVKGIQGKQPLVRNHLALGNFFFGTSQEQNAMHCASAWLLYLDKAHHSGQIFDFAGMENFSEFEMGEDGTAVFQWKGFGDVSYRFSGTLKSEGLAGDVQRIDPHSGNTKYLCAITAAQLPPQNADANLKHQTLPGRYSNVIYSDEGGDLVGVDIRFFSTSTGMTGMIIFYEGYWDEPVYTPLALSKIEMDGRTIRFSAQTPSGIARYHLLLTPTGALFNRDDPAPEATGKDIRLKKIQPALPALNQ